MLCGEVGRRDELISRVQSERAALVERIQSLDTTMAAFEPSLNPGAAGVVRAIAGRYGPRGGLTSFLLEQLTAAGAGGLSSRVLIERCAVRFAVLWDEHPNKKSFKDTIRWSLRFLEERGQVEGVAASHGGHQPKVWRAATGPTFADLLVQQEAFDAQDQDSP
jgi:hypothetical protein